MLVSSLFSVTVAFALESDEGVLLTAEVARLSFERVAPPSLAVSPSSESNSSSGGQVSSLSIFDDVTFSMGRYDEEDTDVNRVVDGCMYMSVD